MSQSVCDVIRSSETQTPTRARRTRSRRPCEPLVVHVLQWRLARLRQFEIGRHEVDHAPPRQIAGHQRVEIVLKRLYLIDRPFLRQRREGIRYGARVVAIERRLLAPQRDVDRQRDLLDGRKCVNPGLDRRRVLGSLFVTQ